MPAQTQRTSTAGSAKAKHEETIPSTERFGFSRCIVHKGYVYGLFVEKSLVRVNREDGKYPETLVSTNTAIGNFTVDGSSVYYMSENKSENGGKNNVFNPKGELRRIDLADGAITTLADLDYPADQFIGADATFIYFLSRSDKKGLLVMRIAKSGGQPEPLTANLLHPTGFAVDDKNIYWCDYGNNSVRRVLKAGGEQTVVFDGNRSDRPAVPASMTADKSHLYLMGERRDIHRIDKDTGREILLYAGADEVFFSTPTISVTSNTFTGCSGIESCASIRMAAERRRCLSVRPLRTV